MTQASERPVTRVSTRPQEQCEDVCFGGKAIPPGSALERQGRQFGTIARQAGGVVHIEGQAR